MKISERISHDGKGMPVSPETLVYVEWENDFNNKDDCPDVAAFWSGDIEDWWTAEGLEDPTDVITAYWIVTEE